MRLTVRPLVLAAACALLVFGALERPARPAPPSSAQADADAQIPSGREGDLIRYGRDLIAHTRQYAGKYVRAGMDCSACHIDAGTKPHGGSLLGIYATFPQWNKRSKRFIMLQDRLQECFLYSMNGVAPSANSREIIAMTAYIAWLSRGAEVGKGFANQGFVTVHAAHAPDKANGAKIYAQKCATCHAANGAGNPTAGFPPLWGPTSFNTGAGMNTKMAAFVRANMPLNAPGSLSDQEAADVSAYVLSHPRPKFDPNREITFPSQPAKFF
jgi:thiosulfate dehydrogenase